MPQRYRSPLVLCYLESRTQDEAAQQLGWSVTTLRRRLDKARHLLRARMARRGATLGAGLMAGVLAPSAAQATLTRALRQTVLTMARGVFNGGPVSPSVVLLANGVTSMSNLAKTVIGLAVAIAVAIGLAGLQWLQARGPVAPAPLVQVKQAQLDHPLQEQVKVPAAGFGIFGDPLPKVVTFLGYPAPAVPEGGKDKEDPLIVAMKFMKVPKGIFWMGGGSSAKPPAKQVEIKEDFELAAYTVTQEQWLALMGNNPSWFSRTGTGKQRVGDVADADLKRFPVEQVSWDDVQEFVKKLNEREKGKGWLYRLPTEAEWEYACRNALTTKEDCSFDFYFEKPTNDLSSKQANFNGDFPAGQAAKGPNLGRPTMVGSYPPNKLGLYDMHGNVWQWCSDKVNAKTGPLRLRRGGSWPRGGPDCAAASRNLGAQAGGDAYRVVGFRLARVASDDKEDPLIGAMKFVKVPKGTFWMGGSSAKPPTKQVEIKEDFELAAYTVTQEQWQALMGYNPSWFSRSGSGNQRVGDVADADLKRFPVEQVSWDDVQEFVKKLNEREKGKGWLYRLPTEAEWEYACRNASTTKEDCSFDFYFDKPTNDLSSKQANFNGDVPAGQAAKGPNLGRPKMVGSYPPNKLGLYDIHGNVWQWCSDKVNAKNGPLRVRRGGSWPRGGPDCAAASRNLGAQAGGDAYRVVGFRLARVASDDK
jgi:formylglycine-generating enzyme required for sulfatase activity